MTDCVRRQISTVISMVQNSPSMSSLVWGISMYSCGNLWGRFAKFVQIRTGGYSRKMGTHQLRVAGKVVARCCVFLWNLRWSGSFRMFQIFSDSFSDIESYPAVSCCPVICSEHYFNIIYWTPTTISPCLHRATCLEISAFVLMCWILIVFFSVSVGLRQPHAWVTSTCLSKTMQSLNALWMN